MPLSNIQAEFDSPILFRTCDMLVFESTCTTGSLWLRTSNYYRVLICTEIEHRFFCRYLDEAV